MTVASIDSAPLGHGAGTGDLRSLRGDPDPRGGKPAFARGSAGLDAEGLEQSWPGVSH